MKHTVFSYALLSSMLFSTTSIADSAGGDGKIYNGLGCTEIGNGVLFPDTPNPYGENDTRYTAAGWAYNANTEKTIVVACPIIREHHKNPMKRAWVTVYNQTQHKVQCQIEAFDKQGAYLEQSTDYVFPNSLYPVTGFKSNDNDDDDAGPFDPSFEYVPKLSNPEGYFMLICALPPAERVVTNNPENHGVDYRFAYVPRYMIDEAI